MGISGPSSSPLAIEACSMPMHANSWVIYCITAARVGLRDFCISMSITTLVRYCCTELTLCKTAPELFQTKHIIVAVWHYEEVSQYTSCMFGSL